MNNSGHVVGCSHIAGSAHAFLWDGKTLLDIGASDRYALTTCAYGISGRGEIVGVGVDADALQNAVRFAGGAVVRLADEVADPGEWHFYSADSVNSNGVIVGTGTLAGEPHGFMLVPQAVH